MNKTEDLTYSANGKVFLETNSITGGQGWKPGFYVVHFLATAQINSQILIQDKASINFGLGTSNIDARSVIWEPDVLT